jgi:hypothetical protein
MVPILLWRWPELLAVALLAATPLFAARQAVAPQPEVLDRVLVSVGDEAITQSDAEREYGIELLLEGQEPAEIPDPATLRETCERLVNQRLLALESSPGAAVPEALKAAAARDLEGVRKRFPNPDAYQSALNTLGTNEQELLGRLVEQRQILQTIDQRLRPAAAPDAAEIETYYRETFVPQYLRSNKGPAPPLAEVENQIQEVLVQRKIDQLLAQWLEELKSRRRVRWHSL